MLNRYSRRALGLGLALFLTGAAPAQEPANLSTAKAAVLRYVDTGAYERDVAQVVARARAWIEERVSQRQAGENLAVVLDIDETSLSNLPHMRAMDFGYIPAKWDEWVAAADAEPIGPVRELFQLARRRNVAVFFITGRKESDRPGTVRNLAAAGYDGYARLICKPNGSRLNTRVFKAQTREELARDGWIIIANIGDQQSDLAGGAAEKTFKLPDPFYLIE